MDLKQIYRDLSPEEQARFLDVAGTTDAYMTVHLIHRRRVPRPVLMRRLAEACRAVGHDVADTDVVMFFHVGPSEPHREPPAADTQHAA